MAKVKTEEYSVDIVKSDRYGRFTIVEVLDTNGIRGVGISRRAFGDKKNDKLANTIAEGRARKALAKKKAGQKIYEALMG